MKLRLIFSVLVLAALLLSACGATPEPETIIQTVEVEVEKEVTVVETVEVEVEKEVTVVETVEVEVEKEVTVVETVEVEVEVPAAPAGFEPKNGSHFVVGWVPMNDPLNEYWKAFDDGFKDVITTRGGELIACSPQGDAVKQNDCVEQLVVQDVDLIAVYPLDASAIGAAVAVANEAEIPVVSFTGEVPEATGADVLLTVNVDDWGAGKLAGEAMVAALTEKYGEPKGTVLEVQGLMTMTAAQNRGGGFHEIVDEYPDIEVISKEGNWDTGLSTTVIQDWFTANPDTDAIYFHSEGSGVPGAIAALQAMDRWLPMGEEGHVIMTGEDGTNIGVHAVACGYMEETGDFALADISPLLAALAMDYLEDGSLPEEGDVILRPNTLWKEAPVIKPEGMSGLLVQVPVTAITSDNADHPDLFANKYQGAPNGVSPCGEEGW